MAKKGKIEKNDKRRELVQRFADRRRELVAVLKDPNATPLEKREAQAKIRRMPRDASKVRIRNRCQFSGRPRAYLRRFGLSRIAFRDNALEGLIPGVRKSSW
ncbi:MAG: 30S ribosomal protein S14 [Gemmatimonadota bacterium]